MFLSIPRTRSLIWRYGMITGETNPAVLEIILFSTLAAFLAVIALAELCSVQT